MVQALYIRSAQGMGATRAQVIFSSAPFFGVALSVLYLGESISGVPLLATAIFIVAITLLMRDSHSHTHVHEEMSHNHAHRHRYISVSSTYTPPCIFTFSAQTSPTARPSSPSLP